MPSKSVPIDEGEEEEDTFFSAKPRREVKKPISNNIMQRETFNTDLLFKKKPQPERKEVPKPNNNLFNGDSDEEEEFTFKKKETKPTPKIEKPKNKILNSDSDDDDMFRKKKNDKPKTAVEEVKVTPPPKI